MTQNVKTRVIEIIAEQAVLEPADIKLEQTLEDLGLDSMALIEAIFSTAVTIDATEETSKSD